MGTIVVGDHISTDRFALNNSLPSAVLPRLSWSNTHLERSLTLEAIAPAGAALSMPCQFTAMTLPSIFECAATWFELARTASVLVTESLMPRGVKMRSRMKSSQDLPVTAGITCPAAMNMILLYAYLLRRLEAGLM